MRSSEQPVSGDVKGESHERWITAMELTKPIRQPACEHSLSSWLWSFCVFTLCFSMLSVNGDLQNKQQSLNRGCGESGQPGKRTTLNSTFKFPTIRFILSERESQQWWLLRRVKTTFDWTERGPGQCQTDYWWQCRIWIKSLWKLHFWSAIQSFVPRTSGSQKSTPLLISQHQTLPEDKHGMGAIGFSSMKIRLQLQLSLWCNLSAARESQQALQMAQNILIIIPNCTRCSSK